ncbi:TIGR01457 family HAD-type hydrolase [Salinibacillus xinjiangensis]|uniref:Acid sugar phosphatase n=1 Tax=Salinibacillus xinjiangensis TaxID=1229268 RepID=A0A6G1X2Q4_9BACI|nr:TIGR01457 family HAD-type hydrolase [Salinibacillus xinjiangensis]MRG85176.1 TIGR01457 family HAD-type hydrolase [Salinibacillus xinjiangensis]
MEQYKGYLIDLDGTMYLGSEQIQYAKEFIDVLNDKRIPHLFVTNNSSKRPEQVAEKLQQMGIQAETDQVFTTSMATAAFIANKKKDVTAYAIGEIGLIDALSDEEVELVDENADFVVIGIDRDITYEKLAKGCLNIRDGAEFVSTNADVALPTERGFLPGNGSLTSVLEVSTGQSPTYIGKPEPIIMEQALNKLGLPKEETLMVGDNYHTDILAGMRAGMDTLLVFTGVTSKEELKQYDQQPTYVVDTLNDWINPIK